MTGFFYITGYMFGMACFPLECGISEDTLGTGAFFISFPWLDASWHSHGSILGDTLSTLDLPEVDFLRPVALDSVLLFYCIVMTYFDASKVCTIRLDRLYSVLT